MNVLLRIENGPGKNPEDDPRVKALVTEGWMLAHVRYPDGQDGASAEVELVRPAAPTPPLADTTPDA